MATMALYLSIIIVGVICAIKGLCIYSDKLDECVANEVNESCGW